MDNSLDFTAVSRALNEWARTNPRGMRTGGGSSGGFDHIQLHTRPDPREPEVQLTLRAQLVDGRPVIVVSHSPTRSDAQRPGRRESVVAFGRVGDDGGAVSGRDPGAVCEACGATGTVGRAARTDASGSVAEMHRFCAACWPEQSARYRARWEEEDRRRRDAFFRDRAPAAGPGPGMWFESATWHGTLELVRQIERTMIAPLPPAADDLAQLAAEIREQASAFEGEMPLEVESFLRRYGPPAG